MSFILDGNEYILQTSFEHGKQAKTYLYMSNNKLYTIKIYSIFTIHYQKKFLNECKILNYLSSKCNSIHIPCLKQFLIIDKNNDLYSFFNINDSPEIGILIYNFIEGLVFDKYIDSDIDLNLINLFCDQIFYTIKFLHYNKISHRDIKPSNIIYDPDNKIFNLIDFGFSCYNTCIGYMGTKNYLLPEIYYKTIIPDLDIYKKNDLYSIGVILFIYFEKKYPFNNTTFIGFSDNTPINFQTIINLLITAYQNNYDINYIVDIWNTIK